MCNENSAEGSEESPSRFGSAGLLGGEGGGCAEPYTAASIRILKPEEVEDRFDFAKAGALAVQYGKDRKWIERGLAACRDCGVHPSYFIERYVMGDKSVPIREDVDATFRDLFLRAQ